MGLFNFFTQEIAIDLGTANTLIIHNDKVVVDEPSIVAFDRTTNKVIAIGRQAMQMEGKTHDNIRTVRLIKLLWRELPPGRPKTQVIKGWDAHRAPPPAGLETLYRRRRRAKASRRGRTLPTSSGESPREGTRRDPKG